MGWSFNPFGFQKNLALMQNLVTSYAEELLREWRIHTLKIDHRKSKVPTMKPFFSQNKTFWGTFQMNKQDSKP